MFAELTKGRINEQSGGGKKNHSGQRKAGGKIYRRSQMVGSEASIYFCRQCSF